jgi:hypothetical protein
MFSRKDTHVQPTKSFTLSHFLADPKPLPGGINDYTYVTFNSSHTPSYHFFGAETVGMAIMSGHSGCFLRIPHVIVLHSVHPKYTACRLKLLGLYTRGTLVRHLSEILPFESKDKLSMYTPLRHVE